MYLTVKQKLKHLSKEEYITLRELSHTAKNLYNEAVYNVRQHYFSCGKYLSYNENYKLLKNSENYRKLNSNMAQQIIMEVDRAFKSFFALLKLKKNGKHTEKVKIPGYLDKAGFMTLIIGDVRIKEDRLVIPFSNSFRKEHNRIYIKLPPVLSDKQVKEIRIIPKYDARFFEIQYIYKAECKKENLDKTHALAIDLGVNNLATCVTNKGKSFIIDGRKLKSYNQWFNKENARLCGIKDRQKYGKKLTKRQKALWNRRNKIVNDYMSKAARMIINYCIQNSIGTLVYGYNKEFQKSVKMLKKSKQNFVNIPFGKLRLKLKYLCEMYGIDFVEQEESYTSKASFWEKDDIPVYGETDEEKTVFSGRRIHRGLYRTEKNISFNADVNGALNIMRKSKVVSLSALYCSGVVDTPVRIRVA